MKVTDEADRQKKTSKQILNIIVYESSLCLQMDCPFMWEIMVNGTIPTRRLLLVTIRAVGSFKGEEDMAN